MKIILTISPNEKNTPERIGDLKTALKNSPIELLGYDAKQPADLMFRYGPKFLHVEVKDTNSCNDMWNSKQGHFGDQLVKFVDEPAPSFVVVLGGLEECLSEVPTLTQTGGKTHYAHKGIQESNKTSLRALSADCVGSGIPIFYLSKNRVLSFKWTLSYAKNILEGGNPFQWCSRHKGKARRIRALMGNGIGEKNAESLLEHFGSIKAIAIAGYEDLIKCPGIGPERAISIMELMKA